MSKRRTAPLKPMMWYHSDTEQRSIPKREKRGRKREDTVHLFSEWRVFRSIRTGFHTETMARIHPAVLSLLLSLPILRLSICPWAETHGTSCSAQHTPAKSSLPAPQLFSFTPTLLFPGRALTALHIRSNGIRTHKQDKLPLSIDTLPSSVSHTH